MSRESAAVKGLRYLIEGRLTVLEVSRRRILARCKGDSGEEYHLGFDRGWWCDCPARGRCSHLVAFMRVALRPGDE